MKKNIFLLFCSLSLLSAQVFADEPDLLPTDPPLPVAPTEPFQPIAVTVSIGSIGGPLDSAALRTVRQVVGHAVAGGTVDMFAVTSPVTGGPIPIEGGLSFCAEIGFNVPPARFEAFIKELGSIHPQSGTFYHVVKRFSSCNDDGDIVCPEDAKICPDDSVVGRIPPSCEFEPCPNPGLIFCTQDVKECPNGSFVGRVPPGCDFAPCLDSNNE